MSQHSDEIPVNSGDEIALGDFVFLIDTRDLRDRDGNSVELRRQSADVLAYLAEQMGEVVAKDDLIAVIWPDTFVSDGSLVQCIADIRRAIRDHEHKILRTLPKKGYKLVPATSARFDHGQSPANQLWRISFAVVAVALAVFAAVAFFQYPSSVSDQLPPLPSGPKIAVIPFSAIGDDTKSDQLAAGLTEDIAASLSRFSALFVISQNATAQYKGRTIDPAVIRDEIGAQYVLQGSVRRTEESFRVVANLLDTRDAQQIWSDTYDRNASNVDLLQVFDGITEGVVATLGSPDGVILLQEAFRARDSGKIDLDAYECTALRAWFGRRLSQEARAEMLACLEKAVVRSPLYAQAWSDLSNILIETYKNEDLPADEGRKVLDRADAAAKKAIELDNSLETAYYRRAIISQLRGEAYEAFKALADKALAINPNNGLVVGDIGNFSYYSGDLERGKALVQRMMDLDPRYPSWAHYVFFLDHYRNARYPEALSEVLKINFPKHCMIQWSIAAAYGKVGDDGNGQATLDHIAKIEPPCPSDPTDPFLKRGLPQSLADDIMDGLYSAGLAN